MWAGLRAAGRSWLNMAETRLRAPAQVRVKEKNTAFLSSSQGKPKSGVLLLRLLSALFYGISSFLIVVVNKSVLTSYR